MVHVTAFFAGLLAFIFMGLSLNIIKSRHNLRLAFGDGGDAGVIRKIRAQANFAEYVPLALLLMGIDELNGSAKWWLSLLGIVLVAARVSHAFGLLVAEMKRADDIRFRSFGVVATFGVIAILALMAIF